MKFIKLVLLVLISGNFACTSQEVLGALETVNSTIGDGEEPALTESEVIAGLKEALDVGIKNSVSFTSKLDGFYKNPELFIPFPPEAIKVKNTAIDLGLSAQVDKFEMTLNRAAEEATKTAIPIFVNAIKEMSIVDGFAILKGEKNAATKFLRDHTEGQLIEKFSPEVSAAIDQVELTKYWGVLATAYNTANTFTGGEDINVDLQGYVTAHAMDGLFIMVAKEEEKIRDNPADRVTDLLKKVFGSL